MRLTQSLFPEGMLSLHCFVDGPLASIKGTKAERDLAVATKNVTWEALTFELAYKKGQYSSSVVWIGGQLTVSTMGIRAEVKQSIIDDIIADIIIFSTRTYYPGRMSALLSAAAIMLQASWSLFALSYTACGLRFLPLIRALQIQVGRSKYHIHWNG